MLLLDFLRESGTTPIVLLHCYPYEREAGYLAQAFNNVYLDVGLSINHLGARAEAFIARTLELAPFRKILYSSDAFGPAELHYLGFGAVARGAGRRPDRIRGPGAVERSRRDPGGRPDRARQRQAGIRTVTNDGGSGGGPMPERQLDTTTQLAAERTRLAQERTLMAWIRTSTSLIAFGFTIFKFFQYLAEQEGRRNPVVSPWVVGLVLILLGLIALTLAWIQHYQEMKALRQLLGPMPFSIAGVMAGLIAVLGLIALVVVLWRL